jgi:deoxyadenosine/deoxycytidine kinase
MIEDLAVPCGELVYVEGIIGAGKSTYCREVGRRLNYRVIEEPVGDNPYLKLFYSDPKRYAYEMQIYLLHRRIGLQQLAAAEALYSTEYNGSMIDRSLFGDRVFEELHHQDGNISDLQHHAYLVAVRNMQLMIYPPTTLVYLDVEPDVALERIRERDRSCETSISLDYLSRLADGYHRLIESAKSGRFPWSHAVQVFIVQYNAPIVSSTTWNATACGLRRFQATQREMMSSEWQDKKDIPVVNTSVPSGVTHIEAKSR